MSTIATGTAPDLRSTQYAYNLDKQLTQITRPDTQTLSMVYNTAGELIR